jgi:uncharacterized membrane protein YkvA (DUF1232 family)
MPGRLSTDTLRKWARRMKRDAVALWFASRHAGTPWLPKALCVLVVAYALSPIDLIPDFIPVLGFVDDALLLPGLIWLALRLVPAPVLAECRAQAEAWIAERGSKPRSRAGAIGIVCLWLLLAALAGWWFWRR